MAPSTWRRRAWALWSDGPGPPLDRVGHEHERGEVIPVRVQDGGAVDRAPLSIPDMTGSPVKLPTNWPALALGGFRDGRQRRAQSQSAGFSA
jgi:hypothetical protein